jgi:hypothetical protein
VSDYLRPEKNDFNWSTVDGVVRVDGRVVGNTTPTRAAEAEYRRGEAEAAEAEADVMGYEERRSSEDGDVVNAKMCELVDAGLVSEDDVNLIATNHRVYNENYDAVRNLMVGAEVDRPRTDEISRLRAQLKAEDEMTGGRQTARRHALEQRLAGLHK